ncbi:hypothetical protein QJQ45_022911 [Haematococcus lacustris]|nr:hypothetical protein QJQ45_022911 [Haematococcus lacustris]
MHLRFDSCCVHSPMHLGPSIEDTTNAPPTGSASQLHGNQEPKVTIDGATGKQATAYWQQSMACCKQTSPRVPCPQLLASEATIRQLHSELQTAHLRSSLKLRRVKELDIMLHELHDVLEEGPLLLDGDDLAEAAVGLGACEAASKALERRVQLCRHELATLGWQQEVAATASTIR